MRCPPPPPPPTKKTKRSFFRMSQERLSKMITLIFVRNDILIENKAHILRNIIFVFNIYLVPLYTTVPQDQKNFCLQTSMKPIDYIESIWNCFGILLGINRHHMKLVAMVYLGWGLELS